MRIQEGAMSMLQRAMHQRKARQGVLAGNVANADTPGYRRFDLVLDSATKRTLDVQRTHEGHLSPSGELAGGRLVRGPRGTRPDGNGIELDREVIELNRNAGAFRDQAAVLSRLHGLRRIAVTGSES